ncbi:copper resistance D family protein [Trinickia diaoshuihuensis]|jgi:putative copper resistance protein D|uniref:copper resistance D family protein n=1 Tax=Trinickia diaoshuihuensis TaxID=2292265 RepID=UPI000E2886F6|nr:CopD family protein [Trinickia diaoshuihuensis]
MNEGILGTVRLISVAIQNIGFAVVVGALLSRQWLARGESIWQERIGRRLIHAIRAASVLSLLASALAFWAHCALMSDSALLDAGPAVRSMIEATAFGRAWSIGALLTLAVAVIAFRCPSGERRIGFGVWIALAGAALARSNSGHSVDTGIFALPAWLDWLHLLAISAWVGLVWVTAYVVMPRLHDAPGDEGRRAASFVQSLSDTSTYALIVLFVTGAYNGLRGVGTPANLWSSAYGEILLIKLALVFVAAALGGHNRFFEMPKLLATLRASSAADALRPLRRFGAVLHVESVILLGVVIAAAVLASSPLPGTT